MQGRLQKPVDSYGEQNGHRGSLFSFYFLIIYTWEWHAECNCPLKSEDVSHFPEAGVTDGSELPHVGAGTRAQVLCRSSMHS